MTSSLNRPESVPRALEGLSAEDWRPPGQDSATVLKTPRTELPSPSLFPQEWPSHWRRLFPLTAEPAASGSSFERVEGFTLGHFTVERRIGAGAMGAVFLAYDERLHRRVALKILSPMQAGDFNAVQRFQNEAQAAARLDHDHVARVFYYGEEQGLHFIAYEYVAGVNLRDLLRQKRILSPAETVNYGVQIASALRHTSRNGVVHRDIKPSNIIVTSNGRAKLVDLGLAKRDQIEPGGELTVAGTTLGTFDYISPEQARDPRAVDVRSDIYSLGCTLYHLLTGEPPYPEGTALQKLLDHQAQSTPDVIVKNRRVPPALSAIIRKMMASDPHRRYATPEELLVDLSAVARSLGLRMISSDAAVLVPESRLRPSFWDRNFGWVVAAGVLGVAAVGTLTAPGLVERWTASVPRTVDAGREQIAENRDATVENSAITGTPSNGITNNGPGNSPALASSESPLTEGTQSAPGVREVFPSEVADNTEKTSTLVVGNDRSAVTAKVAEPAAATPAPVTAQTSEDLRPISISGSKASYSSLEIACAEARDDDIIELRFNGKRSVPERSLHIGNKRLTIRNAKDFRPILEFTDAGRPADQTPTRLITVSGGALQLFNVELVANVSQSYSGAPWALFSLERPEQLKLDRVTVTVINPSRRSAGIIEYGTAGTGTVSGMPKLGMSNSPPVIRISNSLLRGAAGLFTVREATAAEFYVTGSIVALDDSLLRMTARPSMQMPEASRIKLELDHLTAVLGGSLIVSQPEDSFGEEQTPLLVVARNNLFSVGRDQPLVDLSLTGDAMALKDAFKWQGERNSYDAIKDFMVMRSRQAFGAADRPLDYEAWKSLWGGEISKVANLPIRFHTDVRQLSLQNLTVADVALETGDSINPAVEGAVDGTDLGAPLDKIPAPRLDATR